MAYFVVLSMKRELSKFEFVCLALSFGLGVLTKGTFFVYFPPLLALFFLARLRKRGFLKSAAYGLILILVVAVLNTPFWSRNVQTYGGPYGTSEWLQRNLSFDVEFLERFFPDIESTSNEEGMDRNVILDVGEDGLRAKLARAQPEDIPIAREPSIGKDDSPNAVFVYLSRLAMTAGRNFTSPFGFVTDQLIRFVRAFPAVFGVAYPDELKASAWNHEDHAGNLHHLILVPISIILLIFQRSIRRNSLLVSYTITVLCTYALLPIVIGHAPGFWGVRYQLPFFLLWAPIFGVVISALDRNWLTIGAAGLLLTASLPWVLLNNTRPIIGLPPWPTKIESIFTADQDEILLATNPGLRDDFTLTANTIREADCKNVGLVIEADFLEYPLWWLLDAPQSGVQIETLNSYARLSQEINQDFTPCAVVCTICGDMEEFHGLIKAGEFDSITLFLEPELVTK
jgi:4-amino-4-deoxy-L-arabinose transferase-like glycosyltransferase